MFAQNVFLTLAGVAFAAAIACSLSLQLGARQTPRMLAGSVGGFVLGIMALTAALIFQPCCSG